MKQRVVFFAAIMMVAGTLRAQMDSGAVVKGGSAFPVVADLNRDGLDDLLVDGTVLFNQGGTFAAPVRLPIDANELVFAALDANGDGWPDLLTQIPHTPNYRLYLGTGDGGFRPAGFVPTQGIVYVADVDGDGKDDLIQTNDILNGMIRVATNMTLWRSDGTGSFHFLGTYRLPVGLVVLPGLRALAGDLNHDGIPDLVFRCVNDLVVLRGTGGGAFEVETRYLPGAFGYTATALTDIDGDGNLDFILAEKYEVLAFLGDGRGNFPRTAVGAIAKKRERELPFMMSERTQQPRDMAVGNFTTSSHAQIAVGTLEGDVVVLEYRNGALQEVARNQTDFFLVDVTAGSFVSPRHSDVQVSGTGLGPNPSPQILIGREKEPATPVWRPVPARARTIRATVPATIQYNVATRGGCATNDAVWTLRRDGWFGAGRGSDGGNVETFIKDGWLWYRMTVPYASDRIEGVMVARGDGYSGDLAVKTTVCDWQYVSILATPVQ